MTERAAAGWRAFRRNGFHYLYREADGEVLGLSPDAFRVVTAIAREAGPGDPRADRPDDELAREVLAELAGVAAERPDPRADQVAAPVIRALALTALPGDDAGQLTEQAGAGVRAIAAAQAPLRGAVRLHLALGGRVAEGPLVAGILRRVREEGQRLGASLSLSAELPDEAEPSGETLLLLAAERVRPVLMARAATPPGARRRLVRRIDERIGIREMVPVLALDGSPASLIETLEQLRAEGFGAVYLTPAREPGAGSGSHGEQRLAAYLSGWAEEVIADAMEGRRHPTLANWAEVGGRLRARTMGRGSEPWSHGGFAIDARGDLYADARLVGREDGRVGTLSLGPDPGRVATLSRAARAARAGCAVCPAEWSCAIYRIAAPGRVPLERTSCRILRHVLELGIHVQARIARQRPDLLPPRPDAARAAILRLGTYEIHRLNP